MKKLVVTILNTALFAIGPLALAQTFPTTPQHETYDQAVQYEKNKDKADAEQARKEAGETARASRANQTKTAKSKTARKTGQADRSKPAQ